MNLLVTTIIPTYRRPQLLKRAIKSVLNQTYPNFQICIYDNASGDETREVVERFAEKDSRVKYFCHDENIGSLKNFAFGLSKVNTPYFSFLSDDDFLFPCFYETAIKKLKDFNEAAFFAGNCVFVDKNNQITGLGFEEKKDELMQKNDVVDRFVGISFPNWISILFNTEIVRPYKLETYFKICDTDYIYKIMYNHPVYISSKICAVFCSSPISSSFSFTSADMLPYFDIILPKLAAYKTIDLDIQKKVSLRLNDLVKNFIYVKACEHIKRKNREELIKIKSLLAERFEGYDLIRKIDLYMNLREISLIWYPLFGLRRFVINIYHFFSKKIHFYDEKLSVLKLIKLISPKSE